MARTLIIKGANFSDNKVATVVFSGVPCTGLEFETDTINITGSESVEIEYTVTPADTTDAIVWASSNTDIVTVDDGVLTVVGVGSCTVTATCGEYSDTATVTVTMYASMDWIMNTLSPNDSAHVLFYSDSSASTTYVTAYGSGDQTGQYKIYYANSPDNSKPVIKLPKNTGRIKISITDKTKYQNTAATIMRWLKDESAGWSSYPNGAYYDSTETAYNIYSENEKTFTVPSNINAMVFTSKLASAAASLDDAKTAIAASGLKIEFLPPEE